MDAQEWYKRIRNRVKDTFEYRFETFIIDVTEKICRIMSNKGITRAELAVKMNISRPAVSRMLNGNPNFTLKRLLLVADALDYELKVNLIENRISCEIESINLPSAVLDDEYIMYNWNDAPKNDALKVHVVDAVTGISKISTYLEAA